MWFVTLVLLIVAAYFVWDALRDRAFLHSGSSLSAARHDAINPAMAGAGNNMYRNTRGQTGTAAAAGGVAAAAAVAGAAAGVGNRTGRDGPLKFLDAPDGPRDDLCQIDGIGPAIEGELNSIGIYHFKQIAALSQTDIDNVNSELDFPGRIEREKWVDQAHRLGVSGNSAGLTTGAAAGAAATAAAAGVAGVVTSAKASSASAMASPMDSTTNLSEADLTGAWNSDVLIEVQERLKVLNTRASDAPRLNMTADEYKSIKDNDDSGFSRERLLEILERLRKLA